MSLQSRVRDLIRLIPIENGDVGFMSCAVYDTAWVSLVAKPTADGSRQWLFPECFRYVVGTQQPDGGWPAYAAGIDGILNTAASLLALRAHQAEPRQITNYSAEELARRITAGTESLRAQLQAWDVTGCDHVGFEILVPTLLQLLKDQGIAFDFTGRATLMALNEKKLARFRPEFLYAPVKTTALHSLEAFVGRIDFDRVQHHKTFGSYMASPSSTAAVLIHASKWDEESEEYLRWTLASGAGQGGGGMPSAFPSTYFEITWTLSTLLEAGFTAEDLGGERAETFARFLREALDRQNGRLGFAPSVGVDADDTAKGLLTLSLLGHPGPHQGMLDEFEGPTHFRTYSGERNPSFTANCNVLDAMLSQPNATALELQITKTASFLSDIWWDSSNGAIEDKWNLSPYYPSMLMAGAFSRLAETWQRGALPGVPASVVVHAVLPALHQVLVHTLSTQNADGSWGSAAMHQPTREVTAYATLTVCKAACLPLGGAVRARVDECVAAARHCLAAHPAGPEPEHLWVEKVSYGSAVLAESYVLAAFNAPHSARPGLARVVAASSPLAAELDVARVAAEVDAMRLPAAVLAAFDGTRWKLEAAFVESGLLRPAVRQWVEEAAPGLQVGEDVIAAATFRETAAWYAEGRSLSTRKLCAKMGTVVLQQCTMSHASGANGLANGLANGHSNGHSNGGHSNGHTNGTANGHSNGTANGTSNGAANGTSTENRLSKAVVDAGPGLTLLPQHLTYLLPDGSTSSLADTFVHGTSTCDAALDAQLAAAARSTVVAYSESFARVVGPNPRAKLISDRPGSGAYYECGAYVPSHREVWFTSSFASYPKPGYITACNIDTGALRHVPQVRHGAGGYYFDGKVYIGGLSPEAGVTAVDPTTLETSTVLNSYFGLPMHLADDVAWVAPQGPSGPRYLFFTTFFTALELAHGLPALDRPVSLPNGVWRWDPQAHTLSLVVSRLDVAIPNGVRASPDQRTLYVTDSLSTETGGVGTGCGQHWAACAATRNEQEQAATSSTPHFAPGAGPTIYAYDLQHDATSCAPVNRRVFAHVRTGYADGMHVDDAGRVWTAEGEGVVVRCPRSAKVLAVFNAAAFGIRPAAGDAQIANFALAENKLFVGAYDRLYVVELAESLAAGQT
ncbi:hypothetical protein AJ79_09819 [Neofusicoccum parvum]|nr:hypothetical protein AJ79_09819 [Neofusicoccum parvum]